VSDPATTLYLACFFFGLILTVGALATGGLHGPHLPNLHLPHVHVPHIHLPGLHAPHVSAPRGADVGPSPLNLQVLVAFVTFFGGVGAAARLAGVGNDLIFALIGGLFGGGVIYAFLAEVLYPAQTPFLQDDDFQLPGTIARVSSGIRQNGVGEIVFTKGGRRHVEGARSADGSPIPRGEEVLILAYDRGIARVEPFDLR
jgi:hypothetical protein